MIASFQILSKLSFTSHTIIQRYIALVTENVSYNQLLRCFAKLYLLRTRCACPSSIPARSAVDKLAVFLRIRMFLQPIVIFLYPIRIAYSYIISLSLLGACRTGHSVDGIGLTPLINSAISNTPVAALCCRIHGWIQRITKINYAPEAGRYNVQSQPVAFWE
jgi:hypothetical protein